MMYTASLSAYDVLSSVHVHLVVRAFPDDPLQGPSTVIACTTTVPGTGESDPRQWAQDALVAMLEAL